MGYWDLWVPSPPVGDPGPWEGGRSPAASSEAILVYKSAYQGLGFRVVYMQAYQGLGFRVLYKSAY